MKARRRRRRRRRRLKDARRRRRRRPRRRRRRWRDRIKGKTSTTTTTAAAAGGDRYIVCSAYIRVRHYKAERYTLSCPVPRPPDRRTPVGPSPTLLRYRSRPFAAAAATPNRRRRLRRRRGEAVTGADTRFLPFARSLDRPPARQLARRLARPRIRSPSLRHHPAAKAKTTLARLVRGFTIRIV